MIKTVILLVISLIVIAFAMNQSTTIHLPIVSVMITAFMLGYFNPTKGWRIILILWLGVWAIHWEANAFSFLPKNSEAETFATYIAILPAFFGGLMGSFFYKTFNQ